MACLVGDRSVARLAKRSKPGWRSSVVVIVDTVDMSPQRSEGSRLLDGRLSASVD